MLNHLHLVYQLNNITTCPGFSERLEFYLIISLLLVVQMQSIVFTPVEFCLVSIDVRHKCRAAFHFLLAPCTALLNGYTILIEKLHVSVT